MVLDVQCFDYCGTCEEQNAAVTYDVTFNVNTETITVGPNGMYLGGGVLGDATAYAMSDDDADGIWTVTVSIEEGTSGNYIFLNSPNDGGDWGAKEDLTGLSCADPGNFNDRILPAVTGLRPTAPASASAAPTGLAAQLKHLCRHLPSGHVRVHRYVRHGQPERQLRWMVRWLHRHG